MLNPFSENFDAVQQLSDTPGDPGSQLPYQEFPLLPGSYLIGISHFSDPGGFGRVPLCLSSRPDYPLLARGRD